MDMETVDAIAPLYTENQQIDLSSVRRVETDHLLDEPDIVRLSIQYLLKVTFC